MYWAASRSYLAERSKVCLNGLSTGKVQSFPSSFLPILSNLSFFRFLPLFLHIFSLSSFPSLLPFPSLLQPFVLSRLLYLPVLLSYTFSVYFCLFWFLFSLYIFLSSCLSSILSLLLSLTLFSFLSFFLSSCLHFFLFPPQHRIVTFTCAWLLHASFWHKRLTTGVEEATDHREVCTGLYFCLRFDVFLLHTYMHSVHSDKYLKMVRTVLGWHRLWLRRGFGSSMQSHLIHIHERHISTSWTYIYLERRRTALATKFIPVVNKCLKLGEMWQGKVRKDVHWTELV